MSHKLPVENAGGKGRSSAIAAIGILAVARQQCGDFGLSCFIPTIGTRAEELLSEHRQHPD